MSAAQPSPSVSSSISLADRLGTWTSILCAIHCMVTPILLSSSVVLAHLLPSEEWAHRGLAMLVALFGAIALLRGFRRHRRYRVLGCMGAGLACIYAAAWWGDQLPSHGAEVAVTCCGSALLICAHRMNHTFCKRCSCASASCVTAS